MFNMDKKLALEELNGSRKYYDEKLFDLALGKTNLDMIRAKMDEGKEIIQITYGPFSGITDILDKEFFTRHAIQPRDFNDEMFKLIEEEIETEYQIRRKVIRNYINKNGLNDCTEEIIEGLNESARRVKLFNHTLIKNRFELREVLLHDSRASLNFGFDYVDRWKMYNELFGENSN